MSTNRVLFMSALVLSLGVPSLFLGVASPAAADSGATADSGVTADPGATADPDATTNSGATTDSSATTDSGATADPSATTTASDYGGGCVLYPDNRAATIDSLRFRCSPEQQDAIYLAAPRGDVPRGVTNGWVTRPPIMQSLAPPFWIGKTFYTGPDGGYLMNRITGADIEGWRADVYTTPSIADGDPSWALNYDPSPTPPVYDEIREITPGVWFGYSWWRGALQTTLLLTFALTYP